MLTVLLISAVLLLVAQHFTSTQLVATNQRKKKWSPDVNVNLGSPVHISNDTSIAHRQTQVLKRIDEVCKRSRDVKYSQWQEKSLLRHLIVDDKHKLLFCYIPKVGCANWKRVFNTLYGQVSSPEEIKGVNHSSMRLLSEYSQKEIMYRLANYFKFMFVRNPMDRLLSAYRNKFTEGFENFYKRYGVQIVKTFRPNAPLNPKGDDVTFQEFMAYVAATQNQKLNEHWMPYYELCHPCTLKYDYVGYYEYLEEDANFLFKSLKLDTLVHYPTRQSYYSPINDTLKLQFIESVSAATLQRVVRKYQLDFDLYGYPPDGIGGPHFSLNNNY